MHGIERYRADYQDVIVYTFKVQLAQEQIETIYRANRKSMSPEKIQITLDLLELQFEKLIHKDKEQIASAENALEQHIKKCSKHIKKGTNNLDRYKVK